MKNFFSKLSVPWYSFMVERIHVPALDKVDRTLIHLHGPQGILSRTERKKTKEKKNDQDILGIVLYFFTVDSTLVHLHGREGSCSSPEQGSKDLDTLTWSTWYMMQNWTKKTKKKSKSKID